MKLHSSKSLFLSSILLFPLFAYTEEAPCQLTIKQAVDEALTHNFDLNLAAEDVNIAKGQLVTVKTWDNPEFSVGPGAKRLSGSDAERGDRFFRTSVEFNQLFLFPGKRNLELAMAEQDSAASEIALVGMKHQVSVKVRKSFYAVLGAIEIVKLRNLQVSSAILFADSSTKRAESGYAADTDAVRGEAELIKAKKQLSEAVALVIEAKGALNTVLGKEANSPLSLSGKVEEFETPIVREDLIAKGLRENPSYRVQVIKAQKAGLNIDAIELSKAPDFRVGPFVEYGKDEQVYGLGVTLPITLWDQKTGAIASATAEQKKELAELANLKLELTESITTALANFNAAGSARNLYNSQFLKKLKDSMSRAEASYRNNGTTVLIFLDAKRTYFETTADYYETLVTLPARYADLEAAVGVPLNNH